MAEYDAFLVELISFCEEVSGFCNILNSSVRSGPVNSLSLFPLIEIESKERIPELDPECVDSVTSIFSFPSLF